VLDQFSIGADFARRWTGEMRTRLTEPGLSNTN